MAGPFKNKTGVDVDAIIQQGMAASGAPQGVGASPVTSTTGAPPQVPQPPNPSDPRGGLGNLNIDVQSPEFGWAVGQQAFGQADVRRGNYDTGMVPTVNAQMPFGALASRAQGLANREKALAAKMAQFDPYANVGKAHDRYQIAFGNYARGEINSKRQQLADSMFGGDIARADKYLATDPHGSALLSEWSRGLNDIGQQNQHWTGATIDALEQISSGARYMPKEKQEALVRYANAIGPDGMPLQGVSPSEFIPAMRDAEGVIREMQYVDEIVNPVMKNALQNLLGYDILSKKVGGKYVMTTKEVDSYEQAIDHVVNNEDYADLYYDGDKERARQALRQLFPTSVKETAEFISPYTPPSSGPSSEKGMALAEAAYDVTYTEIPTSLRDRERVTTTTKDGKVVKSVSEIIPGESTGKTYPTLTLFNISSDQATFPRAQEFNTKGRVKVDASGRALPGQTPDAVKVTAHPTNIMKIGDKLFIIGRKTTQPRAGTKKSMDMGFGDEDVQDFRELEQVIIPYEGNETIISAAFPLLTDAKIRQALGSAKRQDAGSFQTDDGPVRVASQSDVDKLPPGSKFIWTDDKEYTKD